MLLLCENNTHMAVICKVHTCTERKYKHDECHVLVVVVPCFMNWIKNSLCSQKAYFSHILSINSWIHNHTESRVKGLITADFLIWTVAQWNPWDFLMSILLLVSIYSEEFRHWWVPGQGKQWETGSLYSICAYTGALKDFSTSKVFTLLECFWKWDSPLEMPHTLIFNSSPLFSPLSGDLDAVRPKQPGAHHRCLPARHQLHVLPATHQRDEHRQRLPPLLPAGQACLGQELLCQGRHHFHQSHSRPNRSLVNSG